MQRKDAVAQRQADVANAASIPDAYCRGSVSAWQRLALCLRCEVIAAATLARLGNARSVKDIIVLSNNHL
ncbi:hypothetical protein ACCQ05_06740 [Xanthomonas sp. NCPPB 3582]|uniref:hypothetical protein n=1 Tax=Xanthomonas sp. NCPPB 3582 TaxID=487557 RepID=UPI003556662F